MIIQNGYAGKPFEIKVSARDDGLADMFTEMYDDTKRSEFETTGDDPDSDKFRTEVLHYVSLPELIELRNELNAVIKTLAGV